MIMKECDEMLEKFKRQEIKYLVTLEQYRLLQETMKEYMVQDVFHKSVIKNIYYDTPDYLLIRRSIEKPKYKEKLRIRSYGIKTKDEMVFIELKKKYNGVVFKRRMELKYSDALLFLDKKIELDKSQITKEIKYFIDYYQNLSPKIMLTYERESYKSLAEVLRITFDFNIMWREYDIDLTKECYGSKILNDNLVIMEIKTENGYPKWLVDFLSSNKIYKTSFSKYGNVYKNIVLKGE